jgi:mannosylglycoprotein endo-beta-mannosidase
MLINGVPSRWINYRNGLRQGDPLSPYLFIIVADILRKLLHHPQMASSIGHPLIPNAPCPVLQYAADTLIFLRCSADAIA